MLAQLDTHKITNFLQKTYLGDIEVQFIRFMACYPTFLQGARYK